MGWLTSLPIIKDVVEIFIPNREKQEQRKHTEKVIDSEIDKAALQQFATEFGNTGKRTWFDSLVDGLNRLPRPLLTFGVLFFFVLAPIDPTRFLEIATAYEAMPDGYWTLLTVIVGFYFGGRMQLKSQDMAVKGNALEKAKELVAMRKEFRKLSEEDQKDTEKRYELAVASGTRPPENRVVDEWRKQQTATGKKPTPPAFEEDYGD